MIHKASLKFKVFFNTILLFIILFRFFFVFLLFPLPKSLNVNSSFDSDNVYTRNIKNLHVWYAPFIPPPSPPSLPTSSLSLSLSSTSTSKSRAAPSAVTILRTI